MISVVSCILFYYQSLILLTLVYSTLLYSFLLLFTLILFTLLFSTLLYSSLLYSTLLYFTLLFFTLLFFTNSTLLFFTLLSLTLLYSTLLYSTLLFLSPPLPSHFFSVSLILQGDEAISSSLPDSLFPSGATDVNGQQVDLRTHNSWTMRLHEVVIELFNFQ